ncbi:hypothetical protein K1720_01245 [Thermococcus argininiproducens]|uniref:Uncharacterized protein n=1 Tax=Thermococcus argininiproducens TaxID=2866384 RepID=A0A9E7MAX3_9EURY|nr:hypothetical protein [Thermococcus argininiproducens]USH00138.1 hypothetical protein K1720_01245 [Thermococcus argininiproducens]
MRKGLFGILISVVLVLSISYYGLVSKGQYIFSGYIVEGRPVEVQNAIVLADTDCIPDKEYTTLTCTAIIDIGGEILKVRYTHPIDVPCLSRGDKVNISIEGDSTLRLIRVGKPSMEH